MTDESQLDPLLHALPKDQHDEIFRTQIVPQLLEVAPPVTDPWVTIIAGRPGSMKTTLKRNLLREEEAAANRAGRPFVQPVEFSTDEMRDYHPAWQRLLREDDVTAAFYTTHDCRNWVDEATSYSTTPQPGNPAAGGPKPVFFDVQLNDPDRARRLLDEYRGNGYRVRVAYAASPVAVSNMLALHRYASMREELGGGRFAANPEKSDPGILAAAELIDRHRLADVVQVHPGSDPRPVYSYSSAGPGVGGPPGRTAEALTSQWQQPWSKERTDWFAQQTADLAGRLDTRWYPELAKAVRYARPLAHPTRDLGALQHSLEKGERPAAAPAVAQRGSDSSRDSGRDGDRVNDGVDRHGGRRSRPRAADRSRSGSRDGRGTGSR